ncbi:hypothetical protein C0Q70_19753 [Pomacea canaliculata]|uniref:G-protein coupled receptors family 1 profile domain-containing protein n=1 Tax=Pomacea canaliculata TaxID=400727 RepID=A0A2T7NDM5_POMCA|nr:hypothetical protein C0Q70_19753 [Pomacea canaliculata]
MHDSGIARPLCQSVVRSECVNRLTGFDRASQFLSAVIASERCFCVVSPFHAKRLLKTSTMAAIIVVCCLILVGGMCAIAGPKHTVIEVLNPATNTTIDKFYFTRYYLDNKDILDFFDIYLYATCLPAIFLLVITVTTVVTVISLRSAVFRRQSMTRAKVTRQDNVQSAVSVSSDVTDSCGLEVKWEILQHSVGHVVFYRCVSCH